MNTRWQSETTVIGRLRIRAQAGDSFVTQQRLGAVMRNAQLRPTRLSASAILCLQKFRDPAPGLRWASYHRAHPPPEWEQSASRELDRLVTEAVRPALTPVPTSAESVLFADRAEMLACLALDWLRGTLRTNWWWMTLLHHEDGEAVLAREWISSPEFVPLALDYLARRSQVVPFVTMIRTELASALLSRVLQVFAVPEAKRIESSLDKAETVSQENELQPKNTAAGNPWSLVVPEADAPQLTPLKRIFVAQALMLRRAAPTARTMAFQAAIVHWTDRQARVLADTREPAVADTSSLRSALEPVLPVASGDSTLVEPHHFGESSAEGRRSSPKPPTPRINQLDVRSRPKTRRVRSRLIEDKSAAIPQTNTAGADDPSCAEMPQLHIELAEVAESVLGPMQPAIATVCDEQRANSAFAGVFFLINVALALGLYSDFTSPRGENLQLELWDFLCLLARQFLAEEHGDDPINTVLASLAVRTEAEPPDANFRPPQDWQIPSSWLAPFPEFFEWKEVVRDDRVQVVHPAGFLLKDSALDRRQDTGADLKRWVDWIAGYIRARLARAMGRDDAEKVLCHVAGEIAVTALRVDVYYSLTSYPTEIRLAGLDRDPGWVPAAGRYVAYHFD